MSGLPDLSGQFKEAIHVPVRLRLAGALRAGEVFAVGHALALWVMHSSAYFDIVDEAIANKVYEEAGVVIYGGLPGTLGKPVLVTDKAPVDAIFGLLPNAVVITESQAPGFRSYEVNDEENLAIGYRAEGTVNIDVLGYSWKESTGGSNPTLAAVGSAANWVKHSDSNKVTAGVMITLTTTPPVGG
jgi:hypothetical protein